MRKYLPVIRLGILDELEYRLDLVMHLSKYALAILMMSLVWLAVAKQSGNLPFTNDQIVGYFFGTAILYSLSGFHTDNIEEDIKMGGISKFLLKPISGFKYYWSVQFSKSALETAIKTVVMIPMLFLITNTFQLQPMHFLLWLIFLPVIFAFSFTFFFCISCLAFWFSDVWAIRWSINIAMRFLAGVFIPLSFMPTFWQGFLWWLPFTHLASTPTNLLLGTIPLERAFQGLFILGVWWLGLHVLKNYAWRKGLLQYESNGA